MHHDTPPVIINSVTRDGSFQLGWTLKRAPKGEAAISGLSVPQGKHIKDPITTSLSPLRDKDYWAFDLLFRMEFSSCGLMCSFNIHKHILFVCSVQCRLGTSGKHTFLLPNFFFALWAKKKIKIWTLSITFFKSSSHSTKHSLPTATLLYVLLKYIFFLNCKETECYVRKKNALHMLPHTGQPGGVWMCGDVMHVTMLTKDFHTVWLHLIFFLK